MELGDLGPSDKPMGHLHCLLRSPAAPSQGHQKPPVGLVGGHARVEVPMHTAALVRAANLASGHRRGRPHAADSLDLPLKLLAGLTRHAQLVEQLIHLHSSERSKLSTLGSSLHTSPVSLPRGSTAQRCASEATSPLAWSFATSHWDCHHDLLPSSCSTSKSTHRKEAEVGQFASSSGRCGGSTPAPPSRQCPR